MPYNQMKYGYKGCVVQWGPMQRSVSEADMVALADQANAGGFTYLPALQYGAVMVGLYPAGCRSSVDAARRLYLKSATLPAFMEHQTQTNWCWAACGASVGNYYWGRDAYTQCGIANVTQNKTTCCSNPRGCNDYGHLTRSLEIAKSFDSWFDGTAAFAQLQSRVDQHQPVGTRVAWKGGGAHFTMVAGYNNDGNKITIQDPWYGTSTILFASYPSRYHNGGTWTDTYYTKKAAQP